MKARTVSVGYALLALALASVYIPAAATAGRGVATKSVSTTARKQLWRATAPLKFENLTLYPVLSNRTPVNHRYITLDEGLKSGKVTVSEIGAGGRTRRIHPGREVSDDAEVNTLLVTNRRGRTLILIAGELVVGGKQDRMVGHDCLIEASAKPVRIDVFCVEHGRWSEDSAFGASRADTIGASNPVASRTRRGRGYNSGGGTPQLGGGTGGGAGGGSGPGVRPTLRESLGLFAPAEGVMAAPNVRAKAQATKDQAAVWTEVANAERANNTSSLTGTLNRVFDDKQVRANLDAYERALKGSLPTNAVGIVAAINGELVSADVFASPSLFRAYWPKMLRSLALQATSSAVRKGESPSLADAQDFLTRDGEKQGAGERKPLYRLVERKSDDDASFELEASNKLRSLIHFNKVAKN